MNPSPDTATLLNLDLIKARHKETWEAGDAGKIAETMEKAAEEFMGRLPLQPGLRLLDLACGTGHLALLAARRGCLVSGIDLVAKPIEQARARARREDLRIDFEEGDAEALPCAGCQFDVVVSMFGVMFAPRAKVAAAELRRVVKPGGFVALANWTPSSFMGQLFEILGAHLPPPPAGLRSPLLWGDEATVQLRLRDGFAPARCALRVARILYPFPPAETIEFLRQYDSATHRAFASLDPAGQAALKRDLTVLCSAHNVTTKMGTTEVAAQYLEVVAERR